MPPVEDLGQELEIPGLARHVLAHWNSNAGPDSRGARFEHRLRQFALATVGLAGAFAHRWRAPLLLDRDLINLTAA